LAGVQVNKGDVVDTSAIPDYRLGALVRTGLLAEVEAPSPAATNGAGEGDMCSVCGQGPYKRLAAHMKKHGG
jgi:hypothetical protein